MTLSLLLRLFLLFFFSSRRRHTRLQGDWSSDVCSSDLGSSCWTRRGCLLGDAPPAGAWVSRGRASSPSRRPRGRLWGRSEERRVGKECRGRWGAEEGKEKNKTKNAGGSGEVTAAADATL